MKVLFDVTALLTKNLNSEGVYVRSLYKTLKGIGVDIEAVFEQPRSMKENHIEFHIKHGAKKLWAMFQSKGTILHGASGSFLSENDKFTKVLSVNDMAMFRDGYFDEKTALRLQNHLKEQIQLDPQAVIVPSYDVHNDFLVRFPKMMNRVHVVQPGCDHIIENSNLNDQRIVSAPYFLFVGPIDKRSNVLGVIKAFHGFCELQKEIRLVIVGENGFGSDQILKIMKTSPHRDRISIVGHKPDSQLKKIYIDAIATVVPSFYEGFPYAMVEAMKMGCPVISSAFGVMEEVGRDTAHLLNPKDPEQIMAAMERVLVDTIYRNKLILNGQELTAPLTWLRCARQIADIYQKL